MIRTYLDWLIAVPWSKRSEEQPRPRRTRARCSTPTTPASTTSRTASSSTSRSRSCARSAASRPTRKAGAILTLIGPPGTGKTSIGESIARAMGREFVRMSLGGVRDEAEIRGHRRTYIGALPGRLVRALRDAGTMNPVILLDEVDKVGADWRGDPSAALLEVLDPAQNSTFRDHYLDVELDLSARSSSSRPPTRPRRSPARCWTAWRSSASTATPSPRRWRSPATTCGRASASATACARTRSPSSDEHPADRRRRVHPRGRRAQLERELGTLLRKTATQIASGEAQRAGGVDLDAVRDALGRQKVFQEAAARTAVPGVATGLAVTGTGGDVLFVEANAMSGPRAGPDADRPARRRDEGVRADRADLRARARRRARHRPDDAFDDREFHVHVPAGAIPKDGPSAGVTMTTALASLLTGRPVKHTVGMTGEVTLQGRVLPIGGLKQKVLAAHAAGLTDVILPERNRGDLDDVPAGRARGDDVPPGHDGRRGARASRSSRPPRLPSRWRLSPDSGAKARARRVCRWRTRRHAHSIAAVQPATHRSGMSLALARAALPIAVVGLLAVGDRRPRHRRHRADDHRGHAAGRRRLRADPRPADARAHGPSARRRARRRADRAPPGRPRSGRERAAGVDARAAGDGRAPHRPVRAPARRRRRPRPAAARRLAARRGHRRRRSGRRRRPAPAARASIRSTSASNHPVAIALRTREPVLLQNLRRQDPSTTPTAPSTSRTSSDPTTSRCWSCR